jgi:uncharacterized membrane protein YhaH (DUF805 family)
MVREFYGGAAMNFGQAISSCFAKYATFKGRASRSEFWFCYPFFLIALAVAAGLDVLLGTGISIADTPLGYGYIYLLIALLTIIPFTSVTVRRLHDKDKSGWWYWLFLVPIVGGIVILVWLCQKGTAGENRFGPDPLQTSTGISSGAAA